MNDAPIDKLIEDLNQRIDYWRAEASLTYAETIGALEIIKLDLVCEMKDQNDNGD